MSIEVLPVRREETKEGDLENGKANLQVFSETASESSPPVAKKKGRPRILSPDMRATIEKIYPKLTTLRSVQGKLYMVRAFHLVRDNPDFRFLHDREHGILKETLLTELGRIGNDEDLLNMAREICDQRPTSREAVRMIRGSRLQGRSSPEDTGHLGGHGE